MSANRIQVYQYFQTGDVPTEAQFQFLFSSIRFNDEKVLMSDVSGLDAVIQGTASAEQLNAHFNDSLAHAGTLALLDGSNLKTSDVNAWKSKLNISYAATVDGGGTTGNVYRKDQIEQFINDLKTQDDEALELLEQLRTMLTSNDVNLDELQEVVNYIKENRADIEALQAVVIGQTTDDKINLKDGYGRFASDPKTQRELNRAFYDWYVNEITGNKDMVQVITQSELFNHGFGTDKLIIQVRDSVTGRKMNCEEYVTSTTIQINFLDDVPNPCNVLITKLKL